MNTIRARTNDLQRQRRATSVRKSVNARLKVGLPSGGMVPCTFSTTTIDRDGDRVEQKWTTRGKSVPILWGHNLREELPAIGRAYIHGTTKDGSSTRALLDFAPASIYPMAGRIGALVKRGTINTVSPGFVPDDVVDPTPKERKALGMGPYGVWIKSSELLEISVVNIPANWEALTAPGASKSLRPIYQSVGQAAAQSRTLFTKGMDSYAVEAWHKRATVMEDQDEVAAETETETKGPMEDMDAALAILKEEGLTAERVAEAVALLEKCKEAMGGEDEAEAEPAEEEAAAEPEKAADLAAMVVKAVDAALAARDAAGKQTTVKPVKAGTAKDAGHDSADDEEEIPDDVAAAYFASEKELDGLCGLATGDDSK